MLLSRWLLACRASLLPNPQCEHCWWSAAHCSDGRPDNLPQQLSTWLPRSSHDILSPLFPVWTSVQIKPVFPKHHVHSQLHGLLILSTWSFFSFFTWLRGGGYLQSASLKALSKLVSHWIGALYNLNQDTNPARLDFRASSQPETTSTWKQRCCPILP